MAVRDGRGDVKQTTTGFRGPLMVQSLTSAKSKFLSLNPSPLLKANSYPSVEKHFRHRLKHLFQKHRIPPWQRPYTPQVYLDDELIGLWVLE